MHTVTDLYKIQSIISDYLIERCTLCTLEYQHVAIWDSAIRLKGTVRTF